MVNRNKLVKLVFEITEITVITEITDYKLPVPCSYTHNMAVFTPTQESCSAVFLYLCAPVFLTFLLAIVAFPNENDKGKAQKNWKNNYHQNNRH